MNTSILKLILLLFLIFILVMTLVPMFRAEERSRREIVESELLSCIASLCVTSPTVGDECIIIPPKVAKVRITIDSNEYRRVSISPTSVDCAKTSP